MRTILFAVLVFFSCLRMEARGMDDVTVYTTTTSRSSDLEKSTVSLDKNENVQPGALEIRLDRQVRYQSLDGFGAAVTGSSAYNLSLMPQEKRKAFLEETFSPDRYGFSYVRVPIGCSDFSLSDYTCCDVEGIENFALTKEETEYIIPILKEILAINPDLKIMGTPWTCPKWMKVESLENRKPYDSWTGGQLNPDYYDDYALYFLKWIQAFEKEGIKIYSITPQNEPLNRGNSASLFMGWKEQRDFVKSALGPLLAKEYPAIKIYAFDHNYNYDNMEDQRQYPLRIFEDKEAARYFAGSAYHNYGGDRKELLAVHQARPDKELVFSEASIGEWNSGRDMEKALLRDMEELGIGTVNNWCKAVVLWNLMLDMDQGPHGGPGACATCYGAVDIDPETYSVVTRNSHYYVIAHMASVVKPGATRIGANGGENSDLIYSAFENKDGSLALVICNKGEALSVSVCDGGRQFSCQIPARAIVSFSWNAR